MAACQVFAPAPHVVRLDGTKRAHSRIDCAGSESHHALPDIRCRSTDEAQLHVLQLVKAHRRSVKKLFQCNRSAWLMSDMRLVAYRSEEHTPELQAHLNLVCRLLREKKKW